MSKPRIGKKEKTRENDVNKEENLRGKLREYHKLVEIQKREILSLRKRVANLERNSLNTIDLIEECSSFEKEEPQFEKPIFSAKKCECGGDLEIKIIEGPTSILEFAICNRCKSRERIK